MSEDLSSTPVEVLTEGCRYVGLLATRGYRVSDVLNDRSTEVVELREVLTHLVGAASTDVRWRHISLRKDRILAVIPMGGYEAPMRRRARYVEKPRFGAMVVLPGVVLSGVFYLPSRTTALILLQEGTVLPTFLGMTDVTMHGSPHGIEASHFDAVILRRPSIEAVQLTSQPLPRLEAAGEGLPEAAQATATVR